MAVRAAQAGMIAFAARSARIVALLLVAVVLGAVAGVAAAARPVDPDSVDAGGRLYWGAWIGDHLTGKEAPWDMNAVSAFEQHAGKGVSIIHFSSPFANCSSRPCSFYAFPTGRMESIRLHGSIPFLSWASDSLPVSTDEPAFQLGDITAGAYDAYIRSFAAAAKAWGHPFFLRFNWEMNGDWFPWAESMNGNHPGDSVAAWRHVHDIFGAAGASNVTWVWCPNVGSTSKLAALYPGDPYVDWTCLDGYNTGKPWSSFASLFGASYTLITSSIVPSKPMIVGETGSTGAGAAKAQWITDALTALPSRFPRIKGFLYFDTFGTMDWPIEASSSAQAAFASGIASPTYATNQFGSIGAGTIAPLSP
jgi:hypothetical protein